MPEEIKCYEIPIVMDLEKVVFVGRVKLPGRTDLIQLYMTTEQFNTWLEKKIKESSS